LETTAVLGAQTNWATITNAPITIGDQNTVTIDAAAQAQFYRLRKQ
jgi:hypothetical protein